MLPLRVLQPAAATLLAACLACACATGPAPADRPAAPQPAADAAVPAGHGSLRQEDVTVALRTSSLQLRVTPLNEGILRLLAPDTHARLAATRDRLAAAHALPALAPEPFLVAFYSQQPATSYQPDDVRLIHAGRLLAPLAVAPVTAGWGRPTLDQQEPQLAIYWFEGPVDFGQSIVVRYGAIESDGWRDVVPQLDAERARVRARAGGNTR
jgi:hypothetical protein